MLDNVNNYWAQPELISVWVCCLSALSRKEGLVGCRIDGADGTVGGMGEDEGLREGYMETSYYPPFVLKRGV